MDIDKKKNIISTVDLSESENDSTNDSVRVKYTVKNNKIKDDISSNKTQEEQLVELSNTVGFILSDRRKYLRFSIEDVANTLRIKPKYIEAIEQNNFSILPGYTYAIGFIKSYSNLLHLDTEKIVNIYKQNFTNSVSDFDCNDNNQMKALKKTSNFRNYMTILIMLCFIVFSLFFIFKIIFINVFGKKNNEINEEVITNINSNNSDVYNSNAIINNNSNNKGNEDNSIVSKDNISESSENLDKVESLNSKVYGVDNKSSSRIMLKATGTSWIKLKQFGLYVYNEEKEGDIGSGNTIFEGTLYSGDIYYLPNAEELYLTIGNAKYIDIYLDGNKLKSLSYIDNVSRLNIEINPEKLKLSQ